MGAAPCKCQCYQYNEETGASEAPMALPSPRDEPDMAKVSILSCRGFEQASVTKTYCTCKVPRKAELCMTSVSSSGEYNFAGDITDYKIGDPLLFQVWAAEDKGKELIGKAHLPAFELQARAFEGELQLQETAEGAEAYLKVRVMLVASGQQRSAKEQSPLQQKGDKPAVTVTLVKHQGSDEEIVLKFTKAPLGMSFDADRMPIVINALNGTGQARDLGVREGMVIVKFDGVDLTGMTYDEAFGCISERLKTLPRGEADSEWANGTTPS